MVSVMVMRARVYTEPAFIGFPSLSVVAEMCRTRRSGYFPLEMTDRRGGGSHSGGGKHGGGLGSVH